MGWALPCSEGTYPKNAELNLTSDWLEAIMIFNTMNIQEFWVYLGLSFVFERKEEEEMEREEVQRDIGEERKKK